MKIYLVQHGNQVDENVDPEQPLSQKGIDDCNKVAAFAEKTGIKASKMYHSVKLRAKQTAEIFAKHVGGELNELEGLKPMDDVAPWAEKLEDGLMLVGHLPFMQKFSALLLCSDQEKKCVNFHQGGIVCLIKDDEGNWSIDFMITPEIL
ncbi:phosphohistidine phosphatase SixA [Patescibacteria group bacterium]